MMSETNWGRRKYRTRNWKAYNAALKARSDLSIWRCLPHFRAGVGQQRRAKSYTRMARRFGLLMTLALKGRHQYFLDDLCTFW